VAVDSYWRRQGIPPARPEKRQCGQADLVGFSFFQEQSYHLRMFVNAVREF
jgi:hypothetical protein